jgi:membrane protease YdiL (CAAX protease family)
MHESAVPKAPRGLVPIARALFLVGVVTAWNYASDRLADLAGVDTGSFSSPWKFPLIVLGTAITCGGVVGLGSVVWGKTTLRELGWRFSHPLRLVLVGVAQTAAIIAMIVSLYGFFGGRAGIRELGHALASLSVGQRVFFALMGVKIAFFEETLFRGDLLGALSRRLGALPAIILSSVAFALYHRTLAPVPLMMKFVMGFIFAFAASRTRSLVPSALAHALIWAILCNN